MMREDEHNRDAFHKRALQSVIHDHFLDTTVDNTSDNKGLIYVSRAMNL